MQSFYCEKGQAVVIGDDIIVHVIEVQDDTVQLGIELPEEALVRQRRMSHTRRQMIEGAGSPS